MLVLANEMFDSPPVFAWVLPVIVRLQPGKEETFSPVTPRSKIDSGRAILPSISGERRLPHSQWLVSLRVPKCEADSKPAGRGHQ